MIVALIIRKIEILYNRESDLSEATNVHGVRVRRRLRAVRSPANDDIGSFSWMEGIPEEILVSVLAWCLQGKAGDLAIVSSHPAASFVGNSQPCKIKRNKK